MGLLEEVETGKCVLSLDTDGHIIRTVLLVVLQITFGSKTLIQIAEAKNEKLVPKCVLPGCKLREGETTCQAARRVVDEDLTTFANIVDVGTVTTREKTIMQSKGYGVNSMYIKTIFHGSLESDRNQVFCNPPFSNTVDHAGVPEFIAELQPVRATDSKGKEMLYALVQSTELAKLTSGAYTETLNAYLTDLPV